MTELATWNKHTRKLTVVEYHPFQLQQPPETVIIGGTHTTVTIIPANGSAGLQMRRTIPGTTEAHAQERLKEQDPFFLKDTKVTIYTYEKPTDPSEIILSLPNETSVNVWLDQGNVQLEGLDLNAQTKLYVPGDKKTDGTFVDGFIVVNRKGLITLTDCGGTFFARSMDKKGRVVIERHKRGIVYPETQPGHTKVIG